jgi:hypothetical protein
MDVQGELSKSGRHRVPIPDLLVAAAAEKGGLTVLHYDGDYDIIASVTQETRHETAGESPASAGEGHTRPLDDR